MAFLEQGSGPCYSKDMAKVTSKLQVTVPKALAERYAIRPGDEIAWEAAGDVIRVVTRPLAGGPPLLLPEEARREAEELLSQMEVLYPTEATVRTALRGAAAYQLSWFDAHLWAHAEQFGLNELLSEDFEHDRMYGTVLAVNPFR